MKNGQQEMNVSWAYIDILINRLVAQIQGSKVKFDFILSLNRGGLVPGVMLSHRLGIKHAVMSIESYAGKKQSRLRGGDNVSIVKYPKKKLVNILIVDDIADSGKSFKYAVNSLVRQRKSPFYYETASLHWKPKSIIRPLYVGETVHDGVWVNYPWEKS